jgi:GntR family transcriptional regulator
VIEEGRALFLQIAESIEDQIVDGSLGEESQAPSTNELAAFYRINPATAAKGVSMLVEAGVLYKRRGIGMFVAAGAREKVLTARREAFSDRYLEPLLAEAARIGIGPDELAALITQRAAASATNTSPASTERTDA